MDKWLKQIELAKICETLLIDSLSIREMLINKETNYKMLVKSNS